MHAESDEMHFAPDLTNTVDSDYTVISTDIRASRLYM